MSKINILLDLQLNSSSHWTYVYLFHRFTCFGAVVAQPFGAKDGGGPMFLKSPLSLNYTRSRGVTRFSALSA